MHHAARGEEQLGLGIGRGQTRGGVSRFGHGGVDLAFPRLSKSRNRVEVKLQLGAGRTLGYGRQSLGSLYAIEARV
ncbi:hypothetical protein D3C72_1659580 [compost metagenome]